MGNSQTGEVPEETPELYGPGKADGGAEWVPPGCRPVKLELNLNRAVRLNSGNTALAKGAIQKSRIEGVPHRFVKDLTEVYGSFIPFRKRFSEFILSE